MKARFSTCYEEPLNNLVIESVPYESGNSWIFFFFYIFLSFFNFYEGISGDSNLFVCALKVAQALVHNFFFPMNLFMKIKGRRETVIRKKQPLLKTRISSLKKYRKTQRIFPISFSLR